MAEAGRPRSINFITRSLQRLAVEQNFVVSQMVNGYNSESRPRYQFPTC
jgi:hypothetical protein